MEELWEETNCSCSICRSCCRHKPGWFLPGEAEKVAEFSGVSLRELFESKLAVDWWIDNGDSGNIFLLSPATTHMLPGKEFTANPLGQCIFLAEDERCEIYPVRPMECRATTHGESHEITYERHRAIAYAWREHQQQILSLLGREPKAEPWFLEPFLEEV